jgi:hypothetical protein
MAARRLSVRAVVAAAATAVALAATAPAHAGQPCPGSQIRTARAASLRMQTRIGSIAIPYVIDILFQLRDAGRLSLDDRLSKYSARPGRD